MWIHESKAGEAVVTLLGLGGFESLKLKAKRLFYNLKLLPTQTQHYKPLTFSQLQLVTGLRHSCAEHFKHFFSIMLNSRNLSQLTSVRLQPRRMTLGWTGCWTETHEQEHKWKTWIKTWCPERSRFSKSRWIQNLHVQRNNHRYFGGNTSLIYLRTRVSRGKGGEVSWNMFGSRCDLKHSCQQTSFLFTALLL